MKKSNAVFMILFLLLTQISFAQKQGTLIVDFSFTGIEEGYDHQTYCEIWVDGEKLATSSIQAQSKSNSIKVKMSRGEHRVEIKNFAEYEGVWEEHLVANNYSIDCNYTTDIKLKRKMKLEFLFDINSGTQKL